VSEPVPLSEIPLPSIKGWLESKFQYGILLRLTDDGREAAWYWGLEHAEAAKLLYRMADEVVDQHLPPPPERDQ
jgi:hypothetical protein